MTNKGDKGKNEDKNGLKKGSKGKKRTMTKTRNKTKIEKQKGKYNLPCSCFDDCCKKTLTTTNLKKEIKLTFLLL